jgi:hypothetical protein
LTPAGFISKYAALRGPKGTSQWARVVFRDPWFCLAGASAQNLSVLSPPKWQADRTEEGAILNIVNQGTIPKSDLPVFG